MKSKILLTSFQTWLTHQKSNSSDDLLAILQQQNLNFNEADLFFLRHLTVDTQLASEQVISQIKTIKPKAIICCGMAEFRQKLTIENKAICNTSCLYTSVNLLELTNQLTVTEISQDAGKFVCEGLYYQVLQYTQSLPQNIPCIFVHVPILNQNNLTSIQQDFYSIIKYISKL